MHIINRFNLYFIGLTMPLFSLAFRMVYYVYMHSTESPMAKKITMIHSNGLWIITGLQFFFLSFFFSFFLFLSFIHSFIQSRLIPDFLKKVIFQFNFLSGLFICIIHSAVPFETFSPLKPSMVTSWSRAVRTVASCCTR